VGRAGLQMEIVMFLRLALCIAVAAAAAGLAPVAPLASSSALAQTSAQKPAAGGTQEVTKPDAARPDTAKPEAGSEPDPFGEDATLTARPIVYVKGTGSWDNAFETISKSFQTLKTYIGKEGLKADGEAMTIFTATDDSGFQFQAAIPIAEPPKNPPKGDIAVGASPAGHALKFVHRGSYDGMDNTYEAITNYLDEHRLEAKDQFIEQYLTEPVAANEQHLVVNVFVMVK
jgi:effector-binding domain-containing protein